MAVHTKAMWRIARTDSGTPPVVYELPEAANQTFVPGGPIILDTNGAVQGLGGADDAVVWGIAENAGQNGTNKKARVFRLTTDLVFIGSVLEAAAANHVFVASDMGPMGINYDSVSKQWHLDASEQAGADDRVFVIKMAPDSEVGDTNAKVYFKFLPAAISG